jgi:hypothetical protein
MMQPFTELAVLAAEFARGRLQPMSRIRRSPFG